jgi:hypothetical protein
VKPLLVVSADSRDSVERIRQTPSDESASRNFADGVCKIRSHERSVHTDALGNGEAQGLALHRRVSGAVDQNSRCIREGFEKGPGQMTVKHV